jgi:hypothetical protein
MADPPQLGQPDRTGSELYEFAPDYDDNGGVHTNSGVPNKAAYLIADGTAGEPGGAFNGRAFPGIGTDKTGLLYWSVLQMLTPGADFADLAAALQQSCANLAGAGTGGLTVSDCQSVAAATAATGLAGWAGPSAPREVAMTGGVRTVALRWERPARAGASPVTSYAVHVRPAIGEDDFFPVEPSARRYRLEGLDPATDYTVGLVAVTADGTSPSVVQRFTGSALQVSWPDGAVYGTTTRVRGALTGAGGAPLRKRVVRLFRRDGGSAAYTRVARTRTARNGSFVLRLRAESTARYYVAYAGSARAIGARSPQHRLAVRPHVQVDADPGPVRLGDRVGLAGTVSPARPGAQVHLQRRVAAGGWRTVSHGRVSGDGSFTLVGRATARPSVTWRVVVPRSGRFAAGTSRTVVLPVR